MKTKSHNQILIQEKSILKVRLNQKKLRLLNYLNLCKIINTHF